MADLDEFVNNTDPNNPDTDGDGLSDLDEIETHFTDPLKADGDNDGIADAFEIDLVTNIYELSAEGDFDSDGLTDLEEYNGKTMPNKTDTDGDGLNDKDEYTRGSDPLAPDTDLDGLSDLVETNTGTFVSASNTGSDPTKSDTDNDTFSDIEEISELNDPSNPNDYPKLPEPAVYFDFEFSQNSIADRSLNGNDIKDIYPAIISEGAPNGISPKNALFFNPNNRRSANDPWSNGNYLKIKDHSFDQPISNDGYTVSAWIKPGDYNNPLLMNIKNFNNFRIQLRTI